MAENKPVIKFKSFLASHPLTFLLISVYLTISIPINIYVNKNQNISNILIFWTTIASVAVFTKLVILCIEYRTIQKICTQEKGVANINSNYLLLSAHHLLIIEGLKYRLFAIKHIAEIQTFDKHFTICARVTRANQPMTGPGRNLIMRYYFIDPFEFHFIDPTIKKILHELKRDKRLPKLRSRMNKWWYESIPVHFRFTLPVIAVYLVLMNFVTIARFIRDL